MSEPDPLEHHFAATPREGDLLGAGVRLHYLEWGSPVAPPIVFLHGGGLTAHTWDVVCDLLQPAFRCIAVDLRGHGDSEWPHDLAYGLDSHAADVEKIAAWFGLDRFTLVGMSLGGLSALTYAGSASERLHGLVLVDTGVSVSRRPGHARLRNFMEGPREHASIEEFVERALVFNPLRNRERLRRSLLTNLRRTPHGTWTWKYDPRMRSQAKPDDPAAQRAIEERRSRLAGAARRVSCPTLVVRGSISDIFLDEDAAHTVSLLPNARAVLIDGAGHTVQGDQPYALAAQVRAFFIHDLRLLASPASPVVSPWQSA